jgi:beta-galactosidase
MRAAQRPSFLPALAAFGLWAALVCAGAVAAPAAAAPATAAASATATPPIGRSVQLLAEGWRFHKGDPSTAMQPAHDDSAWRAVRVPHDWSMDEPFRPEYGSGNGYAAGGVGWYRHRFSLPAAQQGRRVRVDFDGVYSHAQVWINGHLLGGRANGYISYGFELTPYLFTDRPNVLAVRVDRSRQTDSRWFTGSGIYRDVRLTYSDPVHIAPWGVFVQTPRITAAQAQVQVQATVHNSSAAPQAYTLRTELLAPDGRAVLAQAERQGRLAAGENISVQQTLQLAKPQRWGPATPVLYTLRSRVLLAGREADVVDTPFGVRDFRFTPDRGFFLNGQPLKLRGVALHHDAGSLGAAVPVSVLAQRLQALQALGVNAIRTSHNPPAPELLQLTDRLGLLVQVEAFDEFTPAKNKWVEGWNVGLPSRHGYAEDFVRDSVRDIEDLVRRDRNHASVVMWSIGNEVDYPNDPFSHPVLGARYRPQNPPASELTRLARPLVQAVKRLDPTRPVTAALASLEMSEAVGLPELLDVVGYNYQEQRYAADRARHPQRVIYGSENRHDYRAWAVVRDTPFISAQFLWTGHDYLGEAGRFPLRAADFGLFDLAGYLKPRGAFRESLWSAQPVVQLAAAPADAATHASTSGQGTPLLDQQRRARVQQHWNWPAGSTLNVAAYANTEAVQLWLNGRLLATQTAAQAVEGVLSFTVPFEAGELRALGLKGGQPVASTVLRTAGPAARIELRPRTVAPVPGLPLQDGVVQVEYTVTDAQGVRVPDAEQRLHFELQGAVEILGIGNGHLGDIDHPRDAHHAAHQGRGLAVLRRTGAVGSPAAEPARLRVSAPGLVAAELPL